MRFKLPSITQCLRLPTLCILCKQYHQHPHAVCHECIALLPTLDNACHLCAHPLPDPQHLVCGHCIKKPPHFDKTITLYQFVDPLRSLLHRFKYEHALYLSSFFAQLMLNAQQRTNDPLPQCLIPVPMHRKKIQARGFNQSLLLTRLLARQLNLSTDLSSCRKVIHTPAQASLTKEKRHNNLRNAFHVQPVSYSHIALVDDVLTTGTTANELAKEYKAAGVKKVEIWCCARAVQ